MVNHLNVLGNFLWATIADRISKIYNTYRVLRKTRIKLLIRLGKANLLEKLKNFLTSVTIDERISKICNTY